MSLSKDLCLTTIDKIANRFGMEEQGNPKLELVSSMGPAPVGALRVWGGDQGVAKMVYIGLVVEQFQLDSHMVFAFTDPESAVPHFTLDSVFAGGHFAFHLDLIPRLDMAVNLAYLNNALNPLTEFHEAARDIEGLSRAHLSPRQLAIMSPWMLAYRATEEAYSQMEPTIQFYLDHWATLVEKGLPGEATQGISGDYLAKRDRAHREVLFSPEVDKVWEQVTRLVGAETSQVLQDELKSQKVV